MRDTYCVMKNNFWLLYRLRRRLVERLNTLLKKGADQSSINETKQDITKVAKELGKWLHGHNTSP